jgi:hypothetical protein
MCGSVEKQEEKPDGYRSGSVKHADTNLQHHLRKRRRQNHEDKNNIKPRPGSSSKPSE